MTVQTIIHAGCVLPMLTPEDVPLFNHSVLIEAGKIISVTPTVEAKKIKAEAVYELPNHVVLPGFVNAHSHAPMNLLRGLGADLALMDWLQKKIWPAEQKLVSPEFNYEGALLAGEEMIRSGITCTNDMYGFPAEVARGLNDAGLKCTVSALFMDVPPLTRQDRIRMAHDTFAALNDNPKARVAVAPHAPYTTTDETLRVVREIAEQYNARIHMHVDETQTEIEGSLKEHGCRPVERLAKLGLLSDRFLSVHTVHPDENEMQLLAEAGAHVVHCPSSNLKLCSGFSPIARMMQLGINIGIGTDSVASNDKLDVLGEARLAAMLGKAASNDPTATRIMPMLYAATHGGARAIGWDDRVGSLETGKDADVIAVHLGDVHTQPIYDAPTHLLYSADRSDITHVWTDGQLVVEKQLLTNLRQLSQSKAQEIAKKWQNML